MKMCIRYIIDLCGHKIKFAKTIVGCKGTAEATVSVPLRRHQLITTNFIIISSR